MITMVRKGKKIQVTKEQFQAYFLNIKLQEENKQVKGK